MRWCPPCCSSNNNLWRRFLVVLVVWFFWNIHRLTPPDCQDSSVGVVFHNEPSALMFRSTVLSSSRERMTRSSVSGAAASNNHNAACGEEYRRVTVDRTPGWTTDDLERSRAHVGNRQRLAQFAQRLILGGTTTTRQPVHVVVCGGSISMGHGVYPSTLRYSDRLQDWLNRYYPITPTTATITAPQQQQQHLVTSMAAHGADVSEFFLL